MNRYAAAAAVALGLTSLGAVAQAQTLGADFSAVRRVYADARVVRIGEAQALELRDIDYAGLHWRAVDFVFNRAGRLDHLTMTTEAASYDEVLKVASTSLKEVPSVSTAAAVGGEDMQIKVCEQRGGGVSVTYEAVPVLS